MPFPLLSFFVVLIAGSFPEKWTTVRSLCFYTEHLEKLESWHRSEMREGQTGFLGTSQEHIALCAARQRAALQGMRPFDADYPDTLDYLKPPPGWQKPSK